MISFKIVCNQSPRLWTLSRQNPVLKGNSHPQRMSHEVRQRSPDRERAGITVRITVDTHRHSWDSGRITPSLEATPLRDSDTWYSGQSTPLIEATPSRFYRDTDTLTCLSRARIPYTQLFHTPLSRKNPAKMSHLHHRCLCLPRVLVLAECCTSSRQPRTIKETCVSYQVFPSKFAGVAQKIGCNCIRLKNSEGLLCYCIVATPGSMCSFIMITLRSQ